MKKIKVRKLKPRFYLILLTVIAVILFSYTIRLISDNNNYEVLDNVAYNVNGLFSYEVCYEKECYDGTNSSITSFVTSLVQNIELKLNYTVETSKIVNFITNYDITADLIITEKGDKTAVLRKRTDTLYKSDNIPHQTSLININKNLDLDFQKYNNEVTEFKKNNLIAVDSTLTINIAVNTRGTYEDIDDSIEVNKVFKISVPLAEQTIKITKIDDQVNNQTGNIAKYRENITYQHAKLHIVGCFICDALVLLGYVFWFIKVIPRQNKYTAKIKKILKEYDRAIIRTKSLPDLANSKLIEVETFEEILDVRDNLEKPIIFCENVRHDKAIFLILNNDEVYRYTINAYEYKVKK